MPAFFNFIGTNADSIENHHDLWGGLLPQDRTSSAGTFQTEKGKGLSYGDYFTAAKSFLTDNHCQNLRKALARVLNQEIFNDAIDTVNLHLVKHGKYYHPTHVKVKTNKQEIEFVLNVAVSEEGQTIIEKEYNNLQRLNNEFPISFLPKVDTFGRITVSTGASIKMFLGEWFHDHHEFHLSAPLQNKDNERHVVVWDGNQTILDEQQTLDLIQKASMILTFYYNPETFEQIFPWHHAAGDFVVKLKKNLLSLKLVTVRGYAPVGEGGTCLDSSSGSVKNMLEALLFFFVHLSIRMRMDRTDGVGDLVLYGNSCIHAIVRGFFQGLNLVVSMRDYPDDFCSVVKTYLQALKREEFIDLVSLFLKRYSRLENSKSRMRLDLFHHVDGLIEAIQHAKIDAL
ncbi:MAG: hypothetical protein PVI90_05915 [Desulfobacteraceae bacterium]|jgi:hypothetical protein